MAQSKSAAVSAVKPVSQLPVLYERSNWAGTNLVVFRCTECGACRDSIDEIQMHVLEKHTPKKDQEKVLNLMLAKEKQNG